MVKQYLRCLAAGTPLLAPSASGLGAEARRHPAARKPGQPSQCVDPRCADHRRRDADDGALWPQPSPLTRPDAQRDEVTVDRQQDACQPRSE